MDPIGDLDQAEEMQSEEEIEDSRGDSKDTSEVKHTLKMCILRYDTIN